MFFLFPFLLVLLLLSLLFLLLLLRAIARRQQVEDALLTGLGRVAREEVTVDNLPVQRAHLVTATVRLTVKVSGQGQDQWLEEEPGLALAPNHCSVPTSR